MAFNTHCGDIGIYYRFPIGVYALNLPINPFSHISTPDGRRCAGGITCVRARAYAGGPTLRSTVHSSTVAGPLTVVGLPNASLVMLRLWNFERAFYHTTVSIVLVITIINHHPIFDCQGMAFNCYNVIAFIETLGKCFYSVSNFFVLVFFIN